MNWGRNMNEVLKRPRKQRESKSSKKKYKSDENFTTEELKLFQKKSSLLPKLLIILAVLIIIFISIFILGLIKKGETNKKNENPQSISVAVSNGA